MFDKKDQIKENLINIRLNIFAKVESSIKIRYMSIIHSKFYFQYNHQQEFKIQLRNYIEELFK